MNMTVTRKFHALFCLYLRVASDNIRARRSENRWYIPADTIMHGLGKTEGKTYEAMDSLIRTPSL